MEELNSALLAALKDQGVIDQMADLGTAPVAEDQATPEAHTQKLESEIDAWSKVLSGITAE